MTEWLDSDILSASIADAKALASEYASAARDRFGDRVKRIRLYGSVVRGDWAPDSDIDILLALDRIDDADSEWLVQQAFRMGVLETGMLLQPVFMTEQTFGGLLRRERAYAIAVEQEGIAL